VTNSFVAEASDIEGRGVTTGEDDITGGRSRGRGQCHQYVRSEQPRVAWPQDSGVMGRAETGIESIHRGEEFRLTTEPLNA
jgi:hypothetical protein